MLSIAFVDNQLQVFYTNIMYNAQFKNMSYFQSRKINRSDIRFYFFYQYLFWKYSFVNDEILILLISTSALHFNT